MESSNCKDLFGGGAEWTIEPGTKHDQPMTAWNVPRPESYPARGTLFKATTLFLDLVPRDSDITAESSL